MLIGGLAQLARAPALHAGGHGFESLILHKGSTYVEPFLFTRLAQMAIVSHPASTTLSSLNPVFLASFIFVFEAQ